MINSIPVLYITLFLFIVAIIATYMVKSQKKHKAMDVDVYLAVAFVGIILHLFLMALMPIKTVEKEIKDVVLTNTENRTIVVSEEHGIEKIENRVELYKAVEEGKDVEVYATEEHNSLYFKVTGPVFDYRIE